MIALIGYYFKAQFITLIPYIACKVCVVVCCAAYLNNTVFIFCNMYFVYLFGSCKVGFCGKGTLGLIAVVDIVLNKTVVNIGICTRRFCDALVVARKSNILYLTAVLSALIVQVCICSYIVIFSEIRCRYRCCTRCKLRT